MTSTAKASPPATRPSKPKFPYAGTDFRAWGVGKALAHKEVEAAGPWRLQTSIFSNHRAGVRDLRPLWTRVGRPVPPDLSALRWCGRGAKSDDGVGHGRKQR
ncbi:hypothetical protein GCM10017774_38950 [Lentzea cavernae]|uniref:Uncharacterized protein n=1 Tax=Lentzea cavernae TaxID=2020703 RepID=A0ABQ3MHI3_9PSEU|nr:hypothetical protein GCM10017774_38950 [Lentzea cavernae]